MKQVLEVFIKLVYYIFLIASLNVFFGTALNVNSIVIIAILFSSFEILRDYIVKEMRIL